MRNASLGDFVVVRTCTCTIQYGIQGSQNTAIDIFVALMARASYYMLRPL